MPSRTSKKGFNMLSRILLALRCVNPEKIGGTSGIVRGRKRKTKEGALYWKEEGVDGIAGMMIVVVYYLPGRKCHQVSR
jgi:hypothetical protein